jgi:hypothetical protein
MKKLSLLTVTLLMVLCFAPQSPAAPQLGRVQNGGNQRDRVCFYQDIHYAGWEDCFSPGDEVGDLKGRKNQISSIRIYGRARVVVYDSTDFRGSTAEFSNDTPDLGLRSLGGRTWSDHIESFRVVDERGYNPPPPPVVVQPAPFPYPRGGGREQTINEGICVYERANFQGRSQCFAPGEDIRDLARVSGMNNRISSIRVFGGARAIIYRDIQFRGENSMVDGDISDLSRVRLRGNYGWNDQISSIEVLRRGNNGRGRGRGPWRY